MDFPVVGLGLVATLSVLVGCPEAPGADEGAAGGPPPQAPEPVPVQRDAARAARALQERAPDRLAALAAPDGTLRVETRQALVETDEREVRVLEGRDAVRGWARALARQLACDPAAEGCRWPEGLAVEGEPRCFGDCCDWGGPDARRVTTGSLRLRRVCLAARQDGERRVTYLGFVEAR